MSAFWGSWSWALCLVSWLGMPPGCRFSHRRDAWQRDRWRGSNPCQRQRRKAEQFYWSLIMHTTKCCSPTFYTDSMTSQTSPGTPLGSFTLGCEGEGAQARTSGIGFIMGLQ